MAKIYRPEHPKPQFMRSDWINLNGQWEFEMEHSYCCAQPVAYEQGAPMSAAITVPFCCESQLSGVGYKDFIQSVWYRRNVTLTKDQLQGRTVLHFGAVDYIATVFVNGQKCGSHTGGYVSFSFDITDYVRTGENTITVHVQDDTRSPLIPSGKQSMERESRLCHYTRTTGIWQTVWLEFTPKCYIKNVKYYPDTENCGIRICAQLEGQGVLGVEAAFEGRYMGSVTCHSFGGYAEVFLPLLESHLWDLGQGNLYDLVLTYGEDRVASYCGLRSIAYTGHKFLLNGHSVFQRLVLDQGFYPDGIYTAPTEEALVADIDRAMAMGFNGARLHEKVFEERFLYHCDKKGYLVWGEFPDWGLDLSRPDGVNNMIPEWLEEIERDFNHPSIVTWCPLNEIWERDGKSPLPELIRMIYRITKSADPTRPCVDASGGFHGTTDIYDLHDYEQDPEKFKKYYQDFAKDFTITSPSAFHHRQAYDQKVPFLLSEYGGMLWDKGNDGWGYGNAPQSPEEFLDRLQKLTDVLLDNEKMFGFCYTQLYDVEQEKNGLYTYERQAKFDPSVIYPIISRPAAIETMIE